MSVQDRAAELFRDSMTEADMTKTIEELVALKSGRCFHLRDARRAPELESLPDLLIFLPGCVAIAELKSQKRPITVGQRQVLNLLQDVSYFFGGIVRPVPYEGERSFDEFLDFLRG